MTAVLPPDDYDQPPPEAPPPPSRRQRNWATAAALLATVAVGIAAVTLAVVLTGLPPDPTPPAPTPIAPTAPPTAGPTTAPTTAPTTVAPTTQPSTPATTTPPATTPPTTTRPPRVPADAVVAVYPNAGRPVRFQDPITAARDFATVLVGFHHPVVGPYRAGDGRSGEVDLRPEPGGPLSTVLVRRMSDGTWWVLGAATAEIQLDTPVADDVLAPPSVTLTGRALAFEGTVDVHIVDDRTARPLGTGSVTGGGDEMRSFEGTVALAAPAAERGAMILTTASARDGDILTASVTRVRFAR